MVSQFNPTLIDDLCYSGLHFSRPRRLSAALRFDLTPVGIVHRDLKPENIMLTVNINLCFLNLRFYALVNY